MGKKARIENRAKRKAAEKAEEQRVRVVIGTAPSGVSLEREIALIKPALIYGDLVVLCSPTATMLEQLVAFTRLPDDQQRLAVGHIAMQAGLAGPEALQAMSAVNALPLLRSSGALTADQLRKLDESEEFAKFEALAATIDKPMRELASVIEGQFHDAGGEEILPAIDAGALVIEQLGAGGDADEIIEALLERLLSALADRRSYVICDEQVGGLITATSDVLDRVSGAEPGGVSSTALHRARRAGAGTGLIAELPSFPRATVAESLDIRRELAPAVVRFRAAMATVEGELVAVDPFSPDFGEAVRLLWESTAAPELLDLEQRVRDNTGLRQLGAAALSDPKGMVAGGAAGMGLMLGTGSNIAGAVGALAGLAGNAVKTHLASKREIAGHRFYLLHATEQRLRRTA